jgi:hypothetical protein
MDFTRGELEEVQAGVYSPPKKTVSFDGTTNNGKVSAAATLSTTLTGNDNDLDFTADTAGSAGNDITIAYTSDEQPAGSAIRVKTSGKAINVRLATTATAEKAQGTMTSDGTNPDTGGSFVVGAKTYTLKSTSLTEVAASAVLTSDNTNVSDDVAASSTLTVSDVMVPATHAESIITSDATNVNDDVAATAVLTSDETNVNDGDTVTVGAIVYRFKTTMSQAYDVDIAADADGSLANLVCAINATGTPGSEYYAGTLIHPTVSAGAVTTHATTLTAKTAGTGGNSLAKAETSDHLDFDGEGAVFTGGAAAETVTIGSTVYRFKNTMAQAYDVKIGADAATTLDNLKAAINASGTAGVEYYAGTLAHPSVVATDNANTTQKVIARVPGTAANTLATTETSAHLSWEATALGEGTGNSNPGVTSAAATVTIGSVTYMFVDVLSETNGAAAIANQVIYGAATATGLDNLKLAINAGATAGTNYSTGTVAHPTVNATDNANTTQKVVADTAGAAGNSIATTTTLTNGAWTSTVLTSGADADTVTVNDQVYTFKTTPAAANDIQIGVDADTSLGNLRAAINGSGTEGVEYFAGTLPATDVTAGAVTSHAITCTADTVGTGGNAYAKAETSAHLDWDGTGAVFTGGVAPVVNEILIGASAAATLDNIMGAVNGTTGEGTVYGTGTTANATVEATTNTNTTQLFEARTAGSAGNAIVFTENATHLSVGGAGTGGGTLEQGTDAGSITSTASDVLAAINASTAAAALVDVALSSGNDGTGLVTDMDATNLSGGSDGLVDLFTVEEDGLIAILGDCTEDLVGSSATLEVGITGNTAGLIPQTTATTWDADERLDKNGVIATTVRPDVTPFLPVRKDDIVQLKVGTASITDGTGTFQMYFKGYEGGSLDDIEVATEATSTAIGTTTDAAVETDADGTISGKARGLVKLLLAIKNVVTGTGATAQQVQGAYSPSTAMQSAAATTGNGTVLVTTGMGTTMFTVSGTYTGLSLVLEGTQDGSVYSTLNVVQLGTNVISTSVSANGIFQASVSGLVNVRARVAAITTGSVTVTGATSAATFTPRAVDAHFPDKLTNTLDSIVNYPAGTNMTVINLETDGATTVNTGATILEGIYVDVAMSAHALPIIDGSATKFNIPASTAAGIKFDFPRPIFSTSLVVNSDDSATGTVVVFWRAG